MDAKGKVDLKDKVVLVTGSGRGLGVALGRAAAARGARVVFNCRADHRRAEDAADRVRRGGGEARAIRADVSDYEQARALVNETLAVFGRIDVLVNTVGGFIWKSVADMEPAEWRAMMSSNLDSVYNVCRLALPSMRKSRFGRIVNIAAVGAERTLGQSKVSAYSAAKAAVVAFSKSLALEEARSGVTVNVVCPGLVRAEDEAAHSADNADLSDRVPVGHAGTSEDVARAVFFFASPAADFVTGQVLAVSGGWLL
jgi:NAD(P)-dependent dehydrogenase (short-subunit alcohol dehydrogenase family)